MTTDTIDLIRRLPHLYHAIEVATMAGTGELDSDYEHELRRLASEMYDDLAEAINACKLSVPAIKRAVIALETLRQAPAKRARINVAGRVLMEIPAVGASVLSERRHADVTANLAAATECISLEANAARTLVELLHTLTA
jgi:hypothetical protein